MELCGCERGHEVVATWRDGTPVCEVCVREEVRFHLFHPTESAYLRGALPSVIAFLRSEYLIVRVAA